MRRSRSINLVSQYLENISKEALEKYQKTIKKYVRGRHGVYALYRGNRLNYVGLASNLRSRLHHHLHDRHAETWDRFSVYLTIGGDHLHELEALVLRITKPKGNRQKGKLPGAEDLGKQVARDVDAAHKSAKEKIFGSAKVSVKPMRVRAAKVKKAEGRTPTLARFVSRRFHIHFRYKGKLYVAHVRSDGSIVFAANSARAKGFKGKVFTSPSLAAREITKHGVDGWYAWKYERAPGDWVFLNELRK